MAVTTSDFPDTHLTARVKPSKLKDDPLYKLRLKQNPELKKNIKKIGEQAMTTVVTFTSKSDSAISRQWHLIFTVDDKGWNSWDISDPKFSGSTWTFTLTSVGEDNRLTQEDLGRYYVADVSVTIKEINDTKKQESAIIESLIKTELSENKIADILLTDNFEVQEANGEEDDSKDGESDTIDAVQSMLTKMLPLTKDLKLGKEAESEVKSLLSKAMGLMKGKGESGKKQKG